MRMDESSNINKFLAEAMGGCYHEWYHSDTSTCSMCLHCGILADVRSGWEKLKPTDFFTWTGFGELWEWAGKQEWFNGLIGSSMVVMQIHDEFVVSLDAINPTNFANAVYGFLAKERDK